MKCLALGLLAAMLATALGVSVALAAFGDYVSDASFNLASANGNSAGITWDGTYFYVVDSTDDKVYAYSSSGTYTSSQNFNLTSNNGNSYGITWDGTYFYVVDGIDDKVYAYSSSGTYTSAQDFNLTSDNGNPTGITWDGTYFYVVDGIDDKVYAYTSSGTYTSAQDFNLTSDNGNPTGITWGGTYLYVVDVSDDKVYAYTSSGSYTSSQDFDLDSDNGNPTGIAWDSIFLIKAVDSASDKVFAYEGRDTGTYGLQDDAEYEVAFSSTVVAYDDWKCIRSESGETIRISNVQVRVHGFCARAKGIGTEVEIHLSATALYTDLTWFADVTGEWWFIETGLPASMNHRIYDDSATSTGDLAFTEEAGTYATSTRLGFTTMAKAVEDDDCTESSGSGFACSRTYLSSLSVGDQAVFLVSLTDDTTVASADTPSAPESLTVSRSADYTTATSTWTLYDAVSTYEIQRLTAVPVNVADASRIEYGDPITYTIAGTQAGIDEYVDSALEAHRTYRYRIRARGADSASWSGWSEYVFSGAEPEVDLPAPGNLELDRDADSVIASWTAPPGDLDNYTLQRQELLNVEGSTFFGNVITLGGASWLSGSSTTYTDTHIIPNQTYEYRIAAVKDDQVGVYSDWFRVGPPVTTLGGAPENFTLLATGQRTFDERREFWMGWDAVPGTDDYEVQILVFDVRTGSQSMEKYIVTDPTFFQTSYGRVGLRVRGRKQDADVCGAATDDRCLTEWTGWWSVRYTPTVTIASPVLVDDTADTSIMQLREDTTQVIEAALAPAGATVDASLVTQFVVVVVGLVLAGLSVVLSWRRGMAPLGVGAGAAILILVLFTGYRLLGTPLAWAVAAQALVAVAGLYALVRQTGVFR